jgi:peptidoglycan hydrolase CwlO-like protein
MYITPNDADNYVKQTTTARDPFYSYLYPYPEDPQPNQDKEKELERILEGLHKRKSDPFRRLLLIKEQIEDQQAHIKAAQERIVKLQEERAAIKEEIKELIS